MLQLLHVLSLEVSVLVALQFSRHPELVEEFVKLGIRHSCCLLVRGDEYIRRLSEVVHRNQMVSISYMALLAWSNDICGDYLEQCPDVILVHQAPVPGSKKIELLRKCHVFGTASQCRFSSVK
jgi:hypothetical protein